MLFKRKFSTPIQALVLQKPRIETDRAHHNRSPEHHQQDRKDQIDEQNNVQEILMYLQSFEGGE